MPKKYFLNSGCTWAHCLPRLDFFEGSTDWTSGALCVKGVTWKKKLKINEWSRIRMDLFQLGFLISLESGRNSF